MYNRYIMTLDPDRFPLERMRDIVDYLHEHDQHYVVMVDPAVAYQEQKYDNLTYETFTKGRDEGIFLYKDGEIFQGVVWPGVTSFPWVFAEICSFPPVTDFSAQRLVQPQRSRVLEQRVHFILRRRDWC